MTVAWRRQEKRRGVDKCLCDTRERENNTQVGCLECEGGVPELQLIFEDNNDGKAFREEAVY